MTSTGVDLPVSARRPVWVVPHTHWDREWYRSFQEFRLRLVELIDGLLPLLESDDRYAHFLLDGQMAVVDDYLEIRPGAEEALRKLARAGRLSMGPWYILMDEFLVSGETIVRDLQLGLRRAADFAGPMEVGYLPDMFGHIAQMPQILSLAGFERAVVWRGVPAGVDAARYLWSAPDGSEILAEYLVFGYGNGAALPSRPAAAAEFVADYFTEVAPFVGETDGVLFMNGTDHQMPKPWLADVVAAVNAEQDAFELVVTSLPDALRALGDRDSSATSATVPRVAGELRSSARANLLMGVSSNRVDVKQAAARAERSLERRAEPLWALFGASGSWPQPFLDLAWRQVILNSAHDSICACSVDEVVSAVLHRYAEARQIGDGLAGSVLSSVALSMARPGAVAVNPSAAARSGVVEVVLPGSDCPEGCQLVRARPEVLFEGTLPGADARGLIGEIRSHQVSDDTFIVEATVESTAESIEVAMRASDRLENELAIGPVKVSLLAAIDANPDLPVHIRAAQPPRCTVLARMPEVPGYGWRRWEPVAPSHPVAAHGSNGLSNGLVTVEVDPEDGTFAVDGLAGFDRLVDGGDHGDTYNFSPPRHDEIVDAPQSVQVRVVESGPVRGVVEVTRTYRWPERIDDALRSRVGERTVAVVTRLALHADERLVRVDTSFVNTCRDHRLRAHFPLVEPATASSAECAFAIVERPLVAEGGPTERGLATYPSRRFVTAGGITVFHEGLLEYELVAADGSSIVADPLSGDVPPARQLALTLLRSTGMLSRVEMAYRPLPAGPPTVMDGPQMLGACTMSYGIVIGECDPYAVVDDFSLPLEVVTGLGEGTRPDTGCELSVAGAVVSALRRTAPGGPVELRAFNASASPATLEVSGPTGDPVAGSVVDLRGRDLQAFAGAVQIAPHAIVTIRLDS